MIRCTDAAVHRAAGAMGFSLRDSLVYALLTTYNFAVCTWLRADALEGPARLRRAHRDHRCATFARCPHCLVPCEYSSGESRAQGGLTKTGNTHARRLLIEARTNGAQPARRIDTPDSIVEDTMRSTPSDTGTTTVPDIVRWPR